ncbi:MAG: hypothetical protein RIB59_14840, partial [Rhodospirillales bacterium]
MTSAFVLLTLTRCASLDSPPSLFGGEEQQIRSPSVKISQFIPADKIRTSRQKIAAEGIRALDADQLDVASKAFNRALKLEINNSYLQFLNGYTYHLIANRGDSSKFALAEEGYKLAVRFDPTNWVAHYHLGLLYLDQRLYADAQKKFADAVFYKSDDPDLFYNLAFSSYYARDPVTAAGALKRLLELKKDDPLGLRASAVVMAALGRGDASNGFLKRYAEVAKNPQQVAFVTQRLTGWKRFYDRYNRHQPAQFEPAPSLGSPSAPLAPAPSLNADAATGAAAGTQAENTNKMAIVDVVIIRTEENVTSSKGVNLLSGLSIQFGASSGTPAFSLQSLNTDNTGSIQSTITKQLNIPSITYSLNIANANTTRNEILARPTLVALSGQPSQFFSGTAITAAAVGGGDSGSTINIDKEIGVKLNVTPVFLPNGKIQLKVFAERTFLSTPNTTSITFTFRIDTTKTNVNANVVMNFGETLILSGLSEKETERNRDGVPGLQDVPGLQYLFSKKTTTDFQKSVLILLTPRPPSYVFRSEKQKKAAEKEQTADERVLTELQARFTDWFRPYPNWASVFHHMQAN